MKMCKLFIVHVYSYIATASKFDMFYHYVLRAEQALAYLALLGFGGGIKGSAGTAAKESKGSAGNEDGSSSDGCEGNTSKSNGGSHENRTDANYCNSSHNTGYASGGSFSTINDGSNNEMSGSGSQFGVSDNSAANNNGPIKISNAYYTQNDNYSTWHSKTSSHWGDSTNDPCATNEGIRGSVGGNALLTYVTCYVILLHFEVTK